MGRFRVAHHSPVGSIVEALRNTDRDTGLDIERIREVSVGTGACAIRRL